MNTHFNNEQNAEPPIAVYADNLKPQPKLCTSCKTELVASDNINHTSFGLDLCEDCLYS